MIGLTFDQFWDLTVYEWGIVVRGFERREKRAMQMLAWQTAHFLNCFSKRRISPKELLGEGQSLLGVPKFILKQKIDAMRSA